MKMLKLSDFDYTLPKALIAQYPPQKRDEARLMVVDRKRGLISHRNFCDITGYLRKDDILILNDTKVLPARLIGKRASGGKVELLLLSRKQNLTFEALLKPGRLKAGEKVFFGSCGIGAVIKGKREVAFEAKDVDSVYALGVMPLPPYIKREAMADDIRTYQTVYAREDGAVAAPTAGLHFTKELLEKIVSSGVRVGFVTLHVGYGTFKPVKEEDVCRHAMEAEQFSVPKETEELLKKTPTSSVIACGTTSCRALESFSLGKRRSTDLFIYPGFQFKVIDSLLTNFHLPRTTLYMLVCAFAGRDLIKKAYQEAIEQKYRFYSYGDAMLII